MESTITISMAIITGVIIVGIMGMLITVLKNDKSSEKESDKEKSYQVSASEVNRYIKNIQYVEKIKKLGDTVFTEKFTYWYSVKLLPNYIAGKGGSITKKEINTIMESFVEDVMLTISPEMKYIYSNYVYSNEQAFKIFLKQFFYMKLNSVELKFASSAVNVNLDNVV